MRNMRFWRPLPFAVLGALALAVSLMGPARAFESECPTDGGWTCTLQADCSGLFFCGPADICDFVCINAEYEKPQWVMDCVNGSNEVLCSECDAPVPDGDCCGPIEDMPACPTGGQCDQAW